MKNMNVCLFSGRLGADPESKNLRNDDGIVCNIRIAVDNTYKKDGKEQGNTEWVPVVLFGHGADYADKYLRKGDKVIVRGQFRTRKWKDKDENDRYTTEIVVDNFNGSIEGCEPKRDDDSDRGNSGRSDSRGRSNDRSRDDRDRDDRGRGRNDDRGRGRDDRGGRRDEGRGRDDDRGRRDEGRRDDDRTRRSDKDEDRGGRSGKAFSEDLDDAIPF